MLLGLVEEAERKDCTIELLPPFFPAIPQKVCDRMHKYGRQHLINEAGEAGDIRTPSAPGR